jgi:dihydrodipicolinate synthase/N-acetylneuraminate lyase
MTYSTRSLHVTQVTPFDPQTGEVIVEELVAYAQKLTTIQTPIPLVPIINAEAGEIYTLTQEEQTRNIEAVVAAGVGPVVAGVVGRTAREAVANAEAALAAGASGLFVLPPYGSADITVCWDPERYPEVVTEYTAKIAEAAGDVPIIIHPTGPRSPAWGLGWPLETVKAVIERVPTVLGWKMTYSYEAYRRIARWIQTEAPHVAVLPSSAVRYHENLSMRQLDGACSGSFAYALEPMIEHMRLWQRGDVSGATDLWVGGLAELHEFVYSDYSRLHIRYKLAAWLAGEISSPLMRDPIPAPTDAEARRVQTLLTAAGLAVRSTDEIDAQFRVLARV